MNITRLQKPLNATWAIWTSPPFGPVSQSINFASKSSLEMCPNFGFWDIAARRNFFNHDPVVPVASIKSYWRILSINWTPKRHKSSFFWLWAIMAMLFWPLLIDITFNMSTTGEVVNLNPVGISDLLVLHALMIPFVPTRLSVYRTLWTIDWRLRTEEAKVELISL